MVQIEFFCWFQMRKVRFKVFQKSIGKVNMCISGLFNVQRICYQRVFVLGVCWKKFETIKSFLPTSQMRRIRHPSQHSILKRKNDTFWRFFKNQIWFQKFEIGLYVSTNFIFAFCCAVESCYLWHLNCLVSWITFWSLWTFFENLSLVP